MTVFLLTAKRILDLVPGWLYACLLVAFFLWGGAVQWRLHSLQGTVAAERVDYANQRATAAENYALAMRAKQLEGERRARLFYEAAAAGRTMLDIAQGDAARARAAGDSLREQVRRALAAAAAPRPSDPPPDAGSQAANQAADLLFDVFGRIDDAAGVLAEFADRSYVAAITCNRQADGLEPAAGN